MNRLTLGEALLSQPGFDVPSVKVGDQLHVTIPDYGIDSDYVVLEVAPNGAMSLEHVPLSPDPELAE